MQRKRRRRRKRSRRGGLSGFSLFLAIFCLAGFWFWHLPRLPKTKSETDARQIRNLCALFAPFRLLGGGLVGSSSLSLLSVSSFSEGDAEDEPVRFNVHASHQPITWNSLSCSRTITATLSNC